MQKIISFILICLGLSSVFFAQEDASTNVVRSKMSPFSIRIDFSVPNPINQAWKKCMVGVAEGNINFNYKIPKTNFFAGIGYKGNLFYTPPKFFIFELKTKMQMHGAYLKLGYDIGQNSNFIISPSLNIGWNATSYSGVVCKTKDLNYIPAYQAWFVEPGVHFNFLPESDFGISCSFSFVLVDHVWNPEYICMDDHISLGDVNRNALTSYYNLGLGIYWGIGKR